MKIKVVIVSVICFFMVVLGVVIAYEKNSNKNDVLAQTAETYFVNPSTQSLELEKRTLQSTDIDAKVDEVLDILLVTGSANKNLKPLTEKPIVCLDSYVQDGSAIVKFGDEFNNLTNIEKIYLKSSIVWSLTSIEGVSSVIFYVNDTPLVTDAVATIANKDNIKFDRNYVVLDPVIDPVNSIQINLKLYFVNEKNGLLNLEQRQNVYANPNTPREYYIVDELIKGTNTPGLISYIPKSTKIINVETDNKICYVNLSEDFVTKQPNDEQINKLSIYQIVNSLTALDDVDGVQILIDSKKSKGFKNGIDLSEVLTENTDFIEEIAEEQ